MEALAARPGPVQGARPSGQVGRGLDNHVADGPSHSEKNVPHIVWGTGGGYLKPGQYVDAGANFTNNRFWNTVITAAIRDKSTATVNFGSGTAGELASIKKA